ncbi:hypothetical protein [Frondihabitans australicus]|uniref:Shikimate kinase n=1 Tax=Frondihabitans australicus TaxID=386892 RepID=A0A495IJG9_9MICO|nr:hypothetical protein [Frondihabitans australicus]RKR75929.1 hypothetical protein C8E83_3093 [Frondihabitans australicus]
MRPLILSGGPAVGKTTCGRLLAGERPRAAFIDADDIRQLVVAGSATLWNGPEGLAQHRLAARNVASLCRDFAEAGFEVVVADVVTAEVLETYRRELPTAFVVHLAIGLDGARDRAATRRVYLTDDEFDLLHRMLADPPPVDLVLDVDGLSLGEQTARLREAWAGASGGGS